MNEGEISTEIGKSLSTKVTRIKSVFRRKPKDDSAKSQIVGIANLPMPPGASIHRLAKTTLSKPISQKKGVT